MNIIEINDKSLQLAEELKVYLDKLFSKLQHTVKIEIVNDEHETYVDVDGCFYVYIDFREKKVETILNTELKKVFHFDIVGITHNPGVMYYSDMSGEPPSEDEVEIATAHSTLTAAGEVTVAYMKMMVSDVIQGVEEEKMFEDQDPE